MKKMLQALLIVGIVYMTSGCAVRMNGGNYDSDWQSGAIVGGVVGGVVGAIVGAAINDAPEYPLYYPEYIIPTLPYETGYGAGYAVTYPACPIMTPTPMYPTYYGRNSERNIIWIYPPTDPRCVRNFMFYEHHHQQQERRHRRRW